MGRHGLQDEDPLLEFVQRLIADQFPGMPSSVQVFVGRFPAEPDVGVPDPPESRLLGTALHRRLDRVVALEAVFDLPTSPGETLTLYESVLLAGGWRPASQQFGPSGPPGFLTASVGHWRTYQQTQDGPVLVVNALPRNGAGTDLRLTVDWEMRRQRPPSSSPYDFALVPPPDVALQPRGLGINNRWLVEASTRSNKAPAELEAYFAAQLAGLGWTRLDSEGTDRLALSAWSVPGAEPSRALLLVVAAFPGECFLSLSVERQGPETDRGPVRSRRWPMSR